MAKTIGILGRSGSGKSLSIGENKELGIIGLNPKETVIVNPMGKTLPFKNSSKLYKGTVDTEGGNYVTKDSFDVLKKLAIYLNEKRKDIKNVVVDDFQHIYIKYVTKEMNVNWDLYRQAKIIGYNLINYLNNHIRDDLNFIFLNHLVFEEKQNMYVSQTVGTTVDKWTIEGCLMMYLYAICRYEGDKVHYNFITDNYKDEIGNIYPVKTPPLMFKEKFIPNDLGVVIKTVNEYY